MSSHPVQFHVRSECADRFQIVVRVVLLCVLASIGLSSIYWLLYLAVPAGVALQLSQRDSDRYMRQHASGIVRALRWIMGAYAYLWLLTDSIPTSEAGGPTELDIEVGGNPTAGSALLRLIYSLPALVLLAVLSMVSSVLWVVGAFAVLLIERMPRPIADFIEMTLRYQIRLVAYHLSLVDAYPSLADLPARHTPHAGAA
jgi:hypothetical protein